MTTEQDLDRAAEILLSLYPLNFRKFFYGPDVSAMDMARFKILGIASAAGPLPISEIGSRLFISRPYMTRLIDDLIREGLIERHTDERDRRLVNILITSKGRSQYRYAQKQQKQRIKKILSTLEPGDLSLLSESMPAISRIFRKMA